MSQPYPPPYDPYNRPGPHQQPPGYGVPPGYGPQSGYGPPPGSGLPHAFGQQPRTGSPVGAVLLAFVASVVVSAVYTLAIVLTYEDQTTAVANTLYVLHAVLNGAVVGVLVGLVGHRSAGARIGGAVVAALGAFFGNTNAVPFVILDQSAGGAVADILRDDPFLPARVWWGSESGSTWISLLGLAAAAGLAWGAAHAVGRSRR
ncbi:hypothetical protein ACWGB8_05990 [Kitasatospora sp. NPDC054939]